MKIVWAGLRRTLWVAVLVAASGCGIQLPGGGDSATSDDAATVNDAFVWYVDDDVHAQGGIEVRGQFTPDRDGTVSHPTIEMAGRSATAYLTPANWDVDEDGPPAREQSLRAGHAMEVEGLAVPVCDGEAHDPPVISVPYRAADGGTRTLHLAIAAKGMSIAETAAYIDDATRQFCSHDVLVTSNVKVNPEQGKAWARYMWMNPGGDTVTVRSKAWQGTHGSRWLATSPHEVPADGLVHTITVRGVDGVCEQPRQTPMSLGLLVVTNPPAGSTVIERHEKLLC